MRNQILCSTGALIGRPNGRDYHLLEKLIPQLKYDGLEFMLYSTWYGEIPKLTAYLKSLNFPIPVVHCQKTVGELITTHEESQAFENFKVNCEVAATIGASSIVMHLWNGIVSDSEFDRNLKAYSTLSSIAGEAGVDLLIENVLCNVSTPMKRWIELKETYPDIHFIFDTKMAKFHDEYKLLFEPEYAWLYEEGHIRHYHVNDYGGGYMDWNNLKVLPIDAGNIDFKPFFDLIRRIGYEGTMTVESTAVRPDGSVDVDMLNGCYDTIRRYLNETVTNI